MAVEVAVRIDGGTWPPEDAFAPMAEAALDAAGLGSLDAEISLLLTTDEAVARLNAQFRAIDKPTNVLSWPAFSLMPPAPGEAPPSPPTAAHGPVALGDIALAAETVMREAVQQNLAFIDHATHLIVHGVLHLLGYDHESEADAVLMEDVECRALKQLGIANPYQ